MFDRQPIGDDFTWMHSEQLGATVLNALGSTPNGQMLKMLDACLVDGFNIQTVASVAINGSNVVLTFGLPHGYSLKQKITISGSDDPLLNGSHRIINQTIDTVTLKISGVTNTAGIVKTKVSPLGFESVIGNSKPLIRGYRSKDPTSTKTVLHLDMSYPEGAGYSSTNPVRRAMVTACTGIDESGSPIGDYLSGVNKKSTHANGSLFWYEARASSKTTPVDSAIRKSWVIVGNGRYFYFFNAFYVNSTEKARDFFAFGDMGRLSVADNHCCLLIAADSTNDSGTFYYSVNGCKVSPYTSDLKKIGYFIGSHSGTSVPLGVNVGFGNLGATTECVSGKTTVEGFLRINPVTESMMLCPAYAYTNEGLRAKMPRLLILPFSADAASLDLAIIDDVLFITVATGQNSPTDFGAFAFDIGV